MREELESKARGIGADSLTENNLSDYKRRPSKQIHGSSRHRPMIAKELAVRESDTRRHQQASTINSNIATKMGSGNRFACFSTNKIKATKIEADR